MAVDLEAPHAHDPALREQLELLLAADRPGHEASRDHGAESRDQERPVDRQAHGTALPLLPARLPREIDESPAQRLEPLAGPRRHRHDGGLLQEGATGQIANVRPRHLHELGRGAVDLGDCDDAAREAEHPDDLEVLARLRHDRLVGGHDEEDGARSAGSRQHVADETLVSRDVDEGDADAVPLRVCESQVDRDATALLLGQSVRVDARQRLDQRGLPVVDVAGRADEKTIHGTKLSRHGAIDSSASRVLTVAAAAR
jgi:hypothetical protein